MEISTASDLSSKCGRHAVVLFYRPQHAQSAQMLSVLEMVAKDFPVTALKVVITAPDQLQEWAHFNVAAVPLCVLLEDGKEMSRVEGTDPPRLVDLTKRLVTGQLSNTNPKDREKEMMQRKLENLVASSPVMIFMKGSKHSPFCRFSKQAVAMLNSLNADFESFDVFEDETVREGMKEFSQWPTFPQLYVNKEFIGGVDIMTEMFKDGSLKQLLQEYCTTDLPLESLVRRFPIMVFMKGDRQNPFCKFSRELMGLFEKADIKEFGTFNILDDERVRQELKEFSQWPTYPQVYVNGKFIGGVDIVKQILEQGGPEALHQEIKEAMTA